MSESDPNAGSFREGDPSLNAPTLASSGICKLCSKGTILRTKVYRMGGAGATVGYLLFILPALWVVLLIYATLVDRHRVGPSLSGRIVRLATTL
jgi:hypothetical protein